jgi:hypothetical protein
MTTFEEAYEYDVESSEFMEDFEVSDEAVRRPLRPVRPSLQGGLSSATLHTPRGPATLTMPTRVVTLEQLKTLEQAVNANTQRLNTVQAELMRVRRELVIRRRGQQGMGSSMMLLPVLLLQQLRGDLEGHTHTAFNAPPVLPGGRGGFGSFLPLLLLLQPGIFGGSSGGQDSSGLGMSPLLLAFLFLGL